MASTYSTMLPLGTRAPRFSLPDVVTGKIISLDSLGDKKALLIMFICRHCPYVKHVQQEIANIARDFRNKEVGIVAITPNDADKYPDDSPASSAEMASELGFIFPFCYDETQEVAKAYHAACTPEFYVFDAAQKLVYRGQLDDSRPANNVPVTGKDVRSALKNALEGKAIDPNQIPSIGCNIKWKPGNQPAY